MHLVLVMTVEPGKGGQALIPETLEKIKPDMLCILEVGYEEDIGLVRVFIGYITYITTKEENSLLLLLEYKSYQTLREIKRILEDDSLSDPECFQKIEAIVCLFEELGSLAESCYIAANVLLSFFISFLTTYLCGSVFPALLLLLPHH